MGLFDFRSRLGNYENTNEELVVEDMLKKFDTEFSNNADDFIVDKGSYADSLKGIKQFDITDFYQNQDAIIAEEIARKIGELDDLEEDDMWNLADDIAFYLYNEDHVTNESFINNFYEKQTDKILNIVKEYTDH